MPIEINWNLLQPVDIGGEFQRGLERGQKFARERAVENALRDYTDTGVISENPDADPELAARRRKAEGVLAAYAPERLNAIETLRYNRQRTQTAIADRQRAVALGGLAADDPGGAADEALRAGDLDLAKEFRAMDKAQKEVVTKRVGAAAPIAYEALKKPEAERKAFIDSNRDYLIASGWRPEELDAFQPTDQALNRIVTAGSTLEQLREQDAVVWHQVGERPSFATNKQGMPIGSGNPYAGAVGALGAGPAAPGGTTGGSASTIESLNNPGALRVPGSRQFQRFGSEAEGVAAQEALLGRYVRRGTNTVASIVEKYAPRMSVGGDNTDEQVNNYISYVSDQLGIKPGETIAPGMVPKVAAAMREFETGKKKPRSASNDAAKVRADAQAAIAAGADPVKVKARAAEMGVTL